MHFADWQRWVAWKIPKLKATMRRASCFCIASLGECCHLTEICLTSINVFRCSYRGVVLFPWTARVYDRDLHHPGKQATPKLTEAKAAENSASVAGEARPKSTSAALTNATVAPEAATASAGTVTATAAATATSTKQTSTGSTSTTATSASSSSSSESGKEVKGKVHTFYQVLIDARDCPYIVSMKESYNY